MELLFFVFSTRVQCTLQKKVAGSEIYITLILFGKCRSWDKRNGGITLKGVDQDRWKKVLCRMEKEGIGLYLDGQQASPDEIIRTCCVCEEAVYMPDFVMNEEGVLREVHYDKITIR